MQCPHCNSPIQLLPSKCPFCTGDIVYERVNFVEQLIGSLKVCAVICVALFAYGFFNSSKSSSEEVFMAVLAGVALTLIGGVGLTVFIWMNPTPMKKN